MFWNRLKARRCREGEHKLEYKGNYAYCKRSNCTYVKTYINGTINGNQMYVEGNLTPKEQRDAEEWVRNF